MSAEYILNRAARLREEMRASGASAYVALNDEDSNWESLFYLSGFRGTASRQSSARRPQSWEISSSPPRKPPSVGSCMNFA